MQTDVGIMLKIAMAQSRQLELMWKKTRRILLMSLSSGDFQITIHSRSPATRVLAGGYVHTLAPVKNKEREKEIRRLEKVEKWLTQEYGMASRGGINSTTSVPRESASRIPDLSQSLQIINGRKVASHGAINSVAADLQGAKEVFESPVQSCQVPIMVIQRTFER
ncbi:hypothetical protein ARMSODRAFT_972764 [Armillaria solidipes]|uniref:Uncharacterized protein n=1 Tax=Armillaria solidipes TaxID=1076256 RepID=A0A2H3BME4_9AGAR|nr:hypothetical protein ARMSODRAFT_972764 [Armillaria solidipes]